MRFTITALGSIGDTPVDVTVGRVVRYLTAVAASPSPTGEGAAPAKDPSRYYADRGDEPGRWLGRGAAAAGLTGAVDRGDFARVLAGRDPRTAERLITAQGSAGRRERLGAGTESRRDPNGQPLYDAADTAVALGLSRNEVADLLGAGERLATRQLFAWVTASTVEPDPLIATSYLLPLVGSDGCRWVGEAELARFEAARVTGPSPDVLAVAGDPDDQFSLAEAARLAGVTRQYLRSLSRRYESNRDDIDALLAVGREPRQAYVVAYRGVKGSWRIRRRDLVAFLRRRTAPPVRVGFDLTLSTEKSLGVLALLGDDEVRREVLAAIQAGNDVGLAHLERHAAARIRGEQVPVAGLTVASFRHLTSRALDPFPHHHNVVANTVVGPDGQRRALDARTLYRHASEASALATAEMRYQLTTRLGLRWRRRPDGGWEVDGIPEPVLREFSRRRTEIEDAVRELEAALGRGTTLDELQSAVLATRPAKRDADQQALTREWWTRARRLGLTPRGLAGCLHRVPQEAPERAPGRVPALFEQLAGPEGVCASGSVFARSDVVAAMANTPVPGHPKGQPLLVPAKRLEELADQFLASPAVVELVTSLGPRRHPARTSTEQLFSTIEMLRTQRRILDVYAAGLHRGHGVVPSADLDLVLAHHTKLSDEQIELVREFCGSGHRVQCAVGRAGAGKTTAMRAAVAAWRTAGYHVVGTAVKGEAARQLAVTAELPTETVAWYLSRHDSAQTLLTERTVLIIDEASTLPDRELARLLQLGATTGTAIRLIGDPAQHGAVGAGGMFRVLCERHPQLTPELQQTHRVQHAGDRAAAEALRAGRVNEALQLLDSSGHLHLVDGEVDLHLDLLHRWWEGRQAGAGHPMVDRRNTNRHTLNRLAHRLLQATGEVDSEEVTAAGDRGFAIGDSVVARRAERRLHVTGDPGAYVRNGALGTVARIERRQHRQDDRLAVRFDGIGTIELPRTFFDEHRQPSGRNDVGLDHAYAVTSYSVQGATYETSASRLDEHASRAEAYVDITRGRSANHLYLTRGPDPLDGESLPKVPSPPMDDTVIERLRHSGPEITAIELDPHAPRPHMNRPHALRL